MIFNKILKKWLRYYEIFYKYLIRLKTIKQAIIFAINKGKDIRPKFKMKMLSNCQFTLFRLMDEIWNGNEIN